MCFGAYDDWGQSWPFSVRPVVGRRRRAALSVTLLFLGCYGGVWGISLQDDDKPGLHAVATTGDDPPALADQISQFLLGVVLVRRIKFYNLDFHGRLFSAAHSS